MNQNFHLDKTDINSSEQSAGIKAMILAAGIGSRLKPWTDHHPKALALVNGKTLLQRNIEYLQQFNIWEVVVNVHHFANQIIEVLEKNNGWGSSITISDETDQLLETGGGLLRARPFLQDSSAVLLMNVDILTNLNLDEMIHNHQENKPLATLATSNRETSRYFLFDKENFLCGWRNIKTGEEKLAASNITGYKRQVAFSGIHLLDPAIFSLIRQTSKFSMVDVYLDLMNGHAIRSFDHLADKFIDVGKPESIAKAEAMFTG